ncbi:MAG: hypothetical protein M0C28_39125 [Candidatus Moduliflexus flocculans]|nr:hypothetical protein [Candidatus Moduliflexus flocculans]
MIPTMPRRLGPRRGPRSPWPRPAPGPAAARDAAVRDPGRDVQHPDEHLSDGPNAWPLRKDLVAGTVSFHRPHVVGLQEVLGFPAPRPRSASFRSTAGWAPAVTTGKKGEYNPVFFLTRKRSGCSAPRPSGCPRDLTNPDRKAGTPPAPGW